MRIALVGAEFEENLSLRTIEAQLLREGHEVELVPFNESRETDEVARRLVSRGADVVGMSMVFTLRAREFADLARRARELGLRSHLTAGGHFAAFNARELLTEVPAFDSVAVGEGELILSELCRNLDQLERVRGLVWRCREGLVTENPPAEKPADLDALPPPTHRAPFDAFLGLPIANLLGSRGCTHPCAFCSIAAWHRMTGGARLRCRAPEAIASEMAALHRRGVRIFNFHDDNFLLRNPRESRVRVERLARALAKEKLGKIAFAIKARPGSVDPDLFGRLRRMGLFRVFLGIEAGTAETLDALGRGQTPDENESALKVVNELDLHACFNLLLLGPDTTLEDFTANVAFLRRHPKNPMNFCRTEVYAGTPLAARLAREGRLLGDFWGLDYRFRDPRTQLLFDVVYPAFRRRNYGLRALHHRTMTVDFEHQLLAHFWGRDDVLRQRVKRFIADVNLDTAGHLARIVADIARGALAPDAPGPYIAEAAALVDEAGRRLGARADLLLEEIRARAAEPPVRGAPGWIRKATAAGLAASLSVAVAGKSKGAGDQAATQMSETVAQPIEGNPALVREKVRQELRWIADAFRTPCRLEVRIGVGVDGRMTSCTARDMDGGKSSDCSRIRLEFAPSQAAGRFFRLEFTQDEVAQAIENATQVFEMAGEPVPTGDPKLVRNVLREKVLPDCVSRLERPRRLRFSFQVDPSGRVPHFNAEDADDYAGISCRVEEFVVDKRAARGRSFEVEFSRSEVAALMTKLDVPYRIAARLDDPCRLEMRYELPANGLLGGSDKREREDPQQWKEDALHRAGWMSREILNPIAARLDAPCRLEVRFRVGPSRRIVGCSARDLDHGKPLPCPALELSLHEHAVDRQFRFVFSREAVAHALERIEARRGIEARVKAGLSADPATIRMEIAAQLENVVYRMHDPCPIEVAVSVDASGRIAGYTAGGGCDTSLGGLSLHFSVDHPEAAGSIFRMKFTLEEVTRALKKSSISDSVEGEIVAPCRAEARFAMDPMGNSRSLGWDTHKELRLDLTRLVNAVRANLRALVSPLSAPSRVALELEVDSSGRVVRCSGRDLEHEISFECPAVDLGIQVPALAERRVELELPRREVVGAASGMRR